MFQSEAFEIEAVDLGDLLKIVIGHDKKNKGDGFFLERVEVQETPEERPIHFECKRYLETILKTC